MSDPPMLTASVEVKFTTLVWEDEIADKESNAWKSLEDTVYTKVFIFFNLFSFATRVGSAQQREPIIVGPYCLTHPVNFPCQRKPDYLGETYDFQQSVDLYFLIYGMDSSHIEKTRVGFTEGGTEGAHLS